MENGTLEVDPGVVYARLQTLRDTDQPAPAAVLVRNASRSAPQRPPIWRYLNVSTGPVEGLNRSAFPFEGFVTPRGSVVVFPHEPNETIHRLLVAHELTHYLQLQSGLQSTVVGEVGTDTTDGGYVIRSLVEGDAVFTTDEYLADSTSSEVRNAPFYDRLQSLLPPGHVARYGNSRYVLGHAYVRTYAEDPAGVADLYGSPPRTSEEILHRLPPGSESPVPLSVDRSVGGDWRYVGSDRMGEAFVRYALESEVGPERSATAAAGWGNDSMEIYRPVGGGDPGYAWVLRWDDAADASTFERTATDAFDRLGEASDGAWQFAGGNVTASVHRPGDRTVVLLVGPRSFPAAATVGGDGATVTLRTD